MNIRPYPPVTTTDTPRLASIPETRRLLGGISRSSIYLLMERNELRSVHIRTRGNLRGRRMILVESIDNYVNQLAAESK